MSSAIFRLSMAIVLIAGAASSSLCADIEGVVTDVAGNRVAGVKLIAMRDRTGDVAGEATSGVKGDYYIPHVAPETYDIALDPAGKPYQPARGIASSSLPLSVITVLLP